MAGLWDYLESRPEAGYAAWLNPLQRNVPETFWESMQRQYKNTYSKYLGELGQTIMGGGVPTLSWMDYLGRQNPLQSFRNLSGYDRGQTVWAPTYRFVGNY